MAILHEITEADAKLTLAREALSEQRDAGRMGDMFAIGALFGFAACLLVMWLGSF